MAGDQKALHGALRAAATNGVLLLAVMLVGGGLLILERDQAQDPVMTAVGTTLLATGALSVGWQAFVGRHHDRLRKGEIREAASSRWSEPGEGVIRVGRGAFTHVELRQALQDCRSFKATCLYDPHWLEREWADPLRDFFARGGKAQFVLPDPRDAGLMERLGLRHGLKPDRRSTVVQQMEGRIEELVRQLTSLSSKPSALNVAYVRDWGPSYTCYLFSSRSGEGMGVTRHYGHVMGSGTALPEILFAEGAGLWKHADQDYERLKSRTVE